jgi:hypothetical protein
MCSEVIMLHGGVLAKGKHHTFIDPLILHRSPTLRNWKRVLSTMRSSSPDSIIMGRGGSVHTRGRNSFIFSAMAPMCSANGATRRSVKTLIMMEYAYTYRGRREICTSYQQRAYAPGVEPQQPPTIFTSPSRAKREMAAAISAGVSS